jgi:hypothetical protein
VTLEFAESRDAIKGGSDSDCRCRGESFFSAYRLVCLSRGWLLMNDASVYVCSLEYRLVVSRIASN